MPPLDIYDGVLIGAAHAFPGPGFLLPTRNHEVFAWCLENRLRLVMQMTLMTRGLYNEPLGRVAAVDPLMSALADRMGGNQATAST